MKIIKFKTNEYFIREQIVNLIPELNRSTRN